MGQSTGEFARSVVSAFDGMTGFDAIQRIEGGGLHVEARVRSNGGSRLSVEYKTVRNPMADVSDRLTGGVEFSPEELTGLVFSSDGRTSWAHDRSTETVYQWNRRHVGEPFPDMELMGELSFLRDLVADYLLRDRGVSIQDGVEVRTIDLKPKRPFRGSLFRLASYPVRTARVSFEVETCFPVHIHMVPSPASPLHAMLGDHGALDVTYGDVRLLDEMVVDAPAAKRVLKETPLAVEQIEDRLGFSLPLDRLTRMGFDVDRIIPYAMIEEEGERGFLEITFRSADSQDEEKRLTLRCGTFLSRNMARRQAFLGEHGDEIDLGDATGRLADRTAEWAGRIPGLEESSLLEIGWQRKGVFWFALGEHVSRDELLRLSAAEEGSQVDSA